MTLLPHEYPDTSNMILEDDTPLDFLNEKQQRLLTTVFYSGAEIPINVPFIVAANVGLFSHVRDLGVVPDVFLSLNIMGGEDWWKRNVHSYLFWEFGKPPDIVIDVVSPTSANKLGNKLIEYVKLPISYCVVYNPLQEISETFLQVFQLQGASYIPKNDTWFAGVNLRLTLWDGVFENINGTWLRWCDESGNVIKRGDEILAEKNAKISERNAEIKYKTSGNLIKTRDEILAEQDKILTEKNAEILQKDAEISQLKQALLLAIEMGLKFRFGDEVAGMLL
ncbi:MAG: hypothetical protein F6K17_36250, partial [Okeania sp. SIO3C4]|nr:hypothetical protein [Okeania sp. SIO3C4]